MRRAAGGARWLAVGLMLSAAVARGGDLTPLERLGERIFFDTNLSSPPGQSCASCHDPAAGFTGPNAAFNRGGAVHQGAVAGRFGNRKPPSVAYASFSPKRHWNAEDETYIGGQFWDGRADDLVEQAKGPFLNPLEQDNASAAEVVRKVRQSDYRSLFERIYGPGSLNETAGGADAAFDRIARALAAYESSRVVNAFSSKYDAYLAGRVDLTPLEKRGLELFEGQANCAACHPSRPSEDGTPPLFTDFSYDNVGAPRNPDNPFLAMPAPFNPDGRRYRDLGLGGVLNDQAQWGKVKVPTLRNVARRPSPDFPKAYLHNGVFKSLKEVVHFYNTRDVQPSQFAPPDVAQNVNRDELGDLSLSEADENALVAFLETLTDGYTPPTESADAVPPDHRDPLDVVRVQRYLWHLRRHPVAAEDRPPRR